MTTIEETIEMNVNCSDEAGILTLNKLTMGKDTIEVLPKDIVVLSTA